MATWRVSLYSLNGGVIFNDIPKQQWRFDYELDGTGSIEVTMWIGRSSVDQVLAGAREFRVFRNNVLVWGGYLWGVRVSRKEQMMTLRGRGYFSRLYRRIIWQDLVKKDLDTATIAWQLINFTQTTDGTFGITNGTNPTGFTVDRAYCYTDKPVVGDSIVELSEMDVSFDWWITPSITDSTNKVFKTPVAGATAARRGTTKAVTLNALTNMDDDYEIDADDMANRIWGTGSGDCNPADFEASNAASIATYGQLHSTAEFDDLDNLPSVKAHTREELRNRKLPLETSDIILSESQYTWGSFDIGDIITVNRPTGYFDAGDQQMRVTAFEASFDPGDTVAFYKVSCSSVVGD